MAEFISVSKAISLIRDNITLGVGGFGGFSAPDELLREMAKSYETSGSPKGLMVVSGISPGDLKEDGFGLSIIKADGIITSIYGAHVGMSPAIGRAVGTGKIAGYTVPLGVYSHLLQAIAGKKVGVITKVGLHTFCDPRLDGCCVNEKAKSSGFEVVSLVKIGGEEYLHYKPFRLDACILRGTYSDKKGNISLEQEPLSSEQTTMAEAVHNGGGLVIVQVKEIVENGALDPRKVQIPGCAVDYVVVSRPENHLQCYDWSGYRPELTGESRAELGSLKPMELTPRKICGRRAAMELTVGALVNLGIGMPDSVASVINEEGLSDGVTFSIETGVFGGVPSSGIALGAAVNPEAIFPIADNFDLYDGGCIDLAVLGAAEIDAFGNVNVSKFGDRCTGPGGFINISQNTRHICFMGTFTAGKMEYEIGDGRLLIKKDGEKIKFKKSVEQITFSARYAAENGQEVLYITERGVFSLAKDGVMLIEIAPGVDLERDILAKMEFKPLISSDLKLMDKRIFCGQKMGLSFTRAE